MSRSRRSSSYESESSSSERHRKKSHSTGAKRKHPSFKYMITEAIWTQRRHIKGSSRAAIRSFIIDKYDVDESRLKSYLASNLSKMLEDTEEGYPCLTRVDNSMNYKLTPEWRKEWTTTYSKKHPVKKRRKKKDLPITLNIHVTLISTLPKMFAPEEKMNSLIKDLVS